MSKKSLLLPVLLFFLLLFASAAFAEEEASSPDPVFAFEKLEYSVTARGTIDLKPILQGAELTKSAVFTWKSSKSEIASVTNKGRVTGLAPGRCVITAEVQDGEDLYVASCTVTVIQPVQKITYDKPEIVIPFGRSVRFQPTVLPENASNRKLRFTSSDPNICTVSQDGTLYGKIANSTCSLSVEALDGSGVKAKFKVMVKTFVVDEKDIVLTERKTYKLVLEPIPSWTEGYCLRDVVNGPIVLGNMNQDINNWWGVASENGKPVLYIEPARVGSYNIVLYDVSATWKRGFSRETVKVTVKPSAVYGDGAFPKLEYEKAAGDPSSYLGQTVLVSGVITDVTKPAGKEIRYTIATKGAADNPVTAIVPIAFTDAANFVVGDRVKIYGIWQEPETTKTETGLSMTNPTVLIEKINDSIFNGDMIIQRARPYNPDAKVS